jgi:hypothetical protein
MAVEVTCEGCGEKFMVADRLAGSSATCPLCGVSSPVPEPETAAPPARPGPAAEPGPSGRDAGHKTDHWQTYYRPVAGPSLWPWVAATLVGVLLVVVLILVLSARGQRRGEGAPAPGPEARRAAVRQEAPPAGREAARAAGPRAVPDRGAPAARPEPSASSAQEAAAATPPAHAAEEVPPGEEEAAFEPLPAGPLPEQAAADFDEALKAWLREVVDCRLPGAHRVPLGTRATAQVGDRRFEGKAYGYFTVFVVEAGEPAARELALQTTAPWPLSEDVVLPPDTYMTIKQGAYSVVDVAGLKARADEIESAMRLADAEAARKNYDGALEILEEARKEHPDAPGLVKRVAEVEKMRRIATIKVVNRTKDDLRFVIRGRPGGVVRAALERLEVRTFRMERGTYLALWEVNGAVPLQEQVEVKQSEVWGLLLLPTPDPAASGLLWRVVRRVESREGDAAPDE